jgi:hypothetical protein
MCTVSASWTVIFFSFLVEWDWVHLVRQPVFDLLYQPRMIDDECGIVGEMRIGRGNRSSRRKLALMSLCPPQILHDLTWARTRAAALGVVNRIWDALSDGDMDRLTPELFNGVVPTVQVTWCRMRSIGWLLLVIVGWAEFGRSRSWFIFIL